MNTLDEEGIPAIVFEALYTNNREHMQFIRRDEQARKLARLTPGERTSAISRAEHEVPKARSSHPPPRHHLPVKTERSSPMASASSGEP